MRRDIENKNPENARDRKLLFCKQSRSAIIEKSRAYAFCQKTSQCTKIEMDGSDRVIKKIVLILKLNLSGFTSPIRFK